MFAHRSCLITKHTNTLRWIANLRDASVAKWSLDSTLQLFDDVIKHEKSLSDEEKELSNREAGAACATETRLQKEVEFLNTLLKQTTPSPDAYAEIAVQMQKFANELLLLEDDDWEQRIRDVCNGFKELDMKSYVMQLSVAVGEAYIYLGVPCKNNALCITLGKRLSFVESDQKIPFSTTSELKEAIAETLCLMEDKRDLAAMDTTDPLAPEETESQKPEKEKKTKQTKKNKKKSKASKANKSLNLDKAKRKAALGRAASKPEVLADSLDRAVKQAQRLKGEDARAKSKQKTKKKTSKSKRSAVVV